LVKSNTIILILTLSSVLKRSICVGVVSRLERNTGFKGGATPKDGVPIKAAALPERGTS